MTEATQQQPAAPANSTEASAKLSTLTADKDWGDRLMAGDANATREFHELTTMIAEGGDNVDQAIAGIVPGDIPDSDQKRMTETAAWMRKRGLSDGVIRQTLTDYEVSPEEFRAVEAWKAQKMRSPEFTKAFLAGEPDAVREMLLADVVLSSKKAEAA